MPKYLIYDQGTTNSPVCHGFRVRVGVRQKTSNPNPNLIYRV